VNLPTQVWGAESIGRIYLGLTEEGLLDVTCDDDKNGEATVTLDLRKVRELRLALARHEREMTRRAENDVQ
jgi:hypothetical protein